MKARLYIVLCIAFITQMAGVLPLQAGHYYYKQISLKEGLPSTVRCILTDEQGFVWIGTRSGLGRFDGHELKKYIHPAFAASRPRPSDCRRRTIQYLDLD